MPEWVVTEVVGQLGFIVIDGVTAIACGLADRQLDPAALPARREALG